MKQQNFGIAKKHKMSSDGYSAFTSRSTMELLVRWDHLQCDLDIVYQGGVPRGSLRYPAVRPGPTEPPGNML
jgi:hypothetical protein